MTRATQVGWITLLTAIVASAAQAGAIVEQFRSGAFGLPWSASADAVQTRYPSGRWGNDTQGHRQYCVASRQVIMKLPAPHQSRELCFLIGADGTLASATARMDASLPELLAVVNRARTMYGDFDAIRRDHGAIQSRFTYMLWTRERPFVVQVGSANDSDGRPTEVTFTVADDASLHTKGADAVSNRSVAAN